MKGEWHRNIEVPACRINIRRTAGTKARVRGLTDAGTIGGYIDRDLLNDRPTYSEAVYGYGCRSTL